MARPVLVVEDDPDLRELLVAIVAQQGHRVLEAGTGEDALDLIEDDPARLAVLDIGLPGIDGFEVADRLDPGVPVIYVTGDPVRAYAHVKGRTSNVQVLPKPFTPDLLEHALSSAL
jgi:DNA-binding response OmpR family regulator